MIWGFGSSSTPTPLARQQVVTLQPIHMTARKLDPLYKYIIQYSLLEIVVCLVGISVIRK
jgi:hypothetical protein